MLLGALIGLSGSPVVGAVIAAILVAAGAYWSVAKVPPGATVPGAAAAALALACIVGVIGGLWVRAHDALSPSVQEDLQQWRDAGYSTRDAQAIVALTRTGLLLQGYSAKPEAVASQRTSALFGGDATSCRQTDPEDYADAANLRQAFTQAGGAWAQYATLVQPLNEAQQRALLIAARSLACQ